MYRCRYVINIPVYSMLITPAPHITDQIRNSLQNAADGIHLETQRLFSIIVHSHDGYKRCVFRLLPFSRIFYPFHISKYQFMCCQKATQGAQIILWVTGDPWVTIGCPKKSLGGLWLPKNRLFLLEKELKINQMGADVVTATVAADAIAVAGTLAQVPNQGGVMY